MKEMEGKGKTAVEKMEKLNTPTTILQRKDIVAARAKFVKDAQARTDTAQVGKDNAQERKSTRGHCSPNSKKPWSKETTRWIFRT